MLVACHSILHLRNTEVKTLRLKQFIDCSEVYRSMKAQLVLNRILEFNQTFQLNCLSNALHSFN